MFDPSVLPSVPDSAASVAPSVPLHRRFTVAEANRSLVYLAPIAREVVAAYAEVIRHRRHLDTLDAGDGDRPSAEAAYRSTMDRLATLVDELSAVGVELRDFEHARLAFPTSDAGAGFLWWQPGEVAVSMGE